MLKERGDACSRRNFLKLSFSGIMAVSLASSGIENGSILVDLDKTVDTKARLTETWTPTTTEMMSTSTPVETFRPTVTPTKIPLFSPTTISPQVTRPPEIATPVPKTYDSVKDAYVAVQDGYHGILGECMTFFNYPVLIDDWVETVSDFLVDHPEINYTKGTGGWGGAVERYDKKGHCLIMVLPLGGDSLKYGGVLIYEAFGMYDMETRYVHFNGNHQSSIYPLPNQQE